jgi:CubicO group peptidase (beta-lactamase class C family)
LGWGIQHTSAGDLFWHWGGAQNGYTSYTASLPARRSGVAIFTNSEDGLGICEEIARLALGETAPHPAFEWLLPLDRWCPDGI